MKPRIALFIGDPAGVGPELVARLLADPDTTRSADLLLIGSRASIDAGMRAAGVRYDAAEGQPELGGVAWMRPRSRSAGDRTTAGSCSTD
jgi:4-hydroxy-L-threonine phosphate dehydrogenase PdxA